MLKQLSIYAENAKGTMKEITDVLTKEGINIWGSVTNDSAEYSNRPVTSASCVTSSAWKWLMKSVH